MNPFQHLARIAVIFWMSVNSLAAQESPYDVFPEVSRPYFRVRYEAGVRAGELQFPVNYTMWIPPGVTRLRAVIVHQHGCGEGSCRSGLTGAFDLHWQALAQRYDCALISPAYEQPQDADCQLWCDPRNGSADAFQQALEALGQQSNHPELPNLPWALWGHSGGGHWAGGMALMYPDRVIAAWLRSGVPKLAKDTDRPAIQPHQLTQGVLRIPFMCNLGTKEGVSVTDGRFSKVWPANRSFFQALRSRGGLIGVAVDPLTSHECGNQRYLAIPWLDVCLAARLPNEIGEPLKPMPDRDVWLSDPTGEEAVAASEFEGKKLEAGWLPNGEIATHWMEYVTDTRVSDVTPPPAPVEVTLDGKRLTWRANADPESGLSQFNIYRDGELLAVVPEKATNPYGRPLFQNLLYSDTPVMPLAKMEFVDQTQTLGYEHRYEVAAVNTVSRESRRAASRAKPTLKR